MTEIPHLDDEALSAVLDGEGTVAEAAHADACPACAARLRVLGDAALLVRTPVPHATDAERDAAVARALDAMPATVIPLRRRPLPVWFAAAAAAAVIAIVAVAGLGSDRSHETAADKAADDSSGAVTQQAPAPAGADAVVDGGDLGEVKGADLRAAIEGAIGPQREAATASGSAAGGGATSDASTYSATKDCEADVRAGNPDLGPLVYRARGTFDGQAVAVLAFDAGARRWVYVVDAASCEIRNGTTYEV